MGQYLSKEDFGILEDSSYYQFPYNKELNLDVLNGYKMTKNYDYYSGKRNFKVSRGLYSSYTRGWIYGYYYNFDDVYKDDNDDDDDDELEKAF
jgi:hypothetical protein